jgi:hypothetical protein
MLSQVWQYIAATAQRGETAMNDTAVRHAVAVEEVSAEDGRAMLNEQTRDKLGISAEEFLRRLDAGDYQNTEDESVLRLVMLAPFGR